MLRPFRDLLQNSFQSLADRPGLPSLPLSVAHLGSGEGSRVHPQTESLERDPCKDDPALDLKGIRVLVVDDESDARETLQQILEHCNAEVQTAPSAAEALRILEVWRPDVLLFALPARPGPRDRMRLDAAAFDAHEHLGG